MLKQIALESRYHIHDSTLSQYRFSWMSASAQNLLQGLDTHVKANGPLAYCLDSRPSKKFPLTWYVRNHGLGGFANTKDRRSCNARFVTIEDGVFVVATKPIEEDEEVIVFYKCDAVVKAAAARRREQAKRRRVAKALAASQQ